MADILNASSLTLNTENAMSVGEVVFSRKFAEVEANKLGSFLGFTNGIVHDKQIPIMGKFTGLSGFNKTTCGSGSTTDNTIASSEKTWTPKYIADRFEDCFTNIQDTFWKYMSKAGLAKEDVSQNTQYEAFVTMRLMEYMGDDMMYRLIFFTDTDIAAETNNSIVSGQLKYFNMIDGVMKQCTDIATATPARLSAIANNAEATFALQAFDSTDVTNQVVTKIFEDMIYSAHMDLRRHTKAERVIICTQSLADQYEKERKANGYIETSYSRTENGINALYIDGVEIIALPTLDAIIDGYYNDGTKWFTPHWALHTTRQNIQIGTVQQSNFKEIKSFYDEYNEKWVVKFGFDMDVKVLEDTLIQVAY